MCDYMHYILILLCWFVFKKKKEQVVGKFRNKYFQPKSSPSLKQTIITLEKVDSLPGKASQITGDQHEELVLTNPKFSFKELQPWQITSLWMSVHRGWVILMYYWSLGWGKPRGKVPEWHFSFMSKQRTVSSCVECGWVDGAPHFLSSSAVHPSSQLLVWVWAVNSFKAAGWEYCNEKTSGKSCLFSQITKVFSLFPQTFTFTPLCSNS